MNAKRHKVAEPGPAPPGPAPPGPAPPGPAPLGPAPPGPAPLNIKEVIFDPITMLLWKLLAIFHDVIHDFGLSIERMSSIVLYINHMADELRNREPQVIQQGGGARTHMRGGVINQQFKITQQSREIRNRQLQRKKTQRILTPSLLPNIVEEINNDRAIIFGENVNIYAINIDERIQNLYITQNNTLAIMALFGDDESLELFVVINKLIDELKLFVILQAISRLDDEHNTITEDTIVQSIQDLIVQVEGSQRATGGVGESEHSPETFTNTQLFIVFILENMRAVFTKQCRYARPPEADARPPEADARPARPDEAAVGDVVADYLARERPYFYLNLFNSQMVHNTIRIIIIRKVFVRDAVPDDADRTVIINAFNNHQVGGRLRGGKQHSNIMYGGTKISLATFRTRDVDSRRELIELLTTWKAINRDQPDNTSLANLYIAFYDEQLARAQIGAAGRINDQRLIRKLNEARFSTLKKEIPLLNGQRTAPSNDRATRSATLDHNAIIIKKMDVFMEQTKSDYDSLITEEQVAEEAEEVAEAAQPLPRAQRNAVYQISKIIAKKGLNYAMETLLAIYNDDVNLSYLTLPNIRTFIPIATQYLTNILTEGRPIDPSPNINLPPVTHPLELDKYSNLLYELYLLGLIYKHTGDGGLPDIDTRLFNYFKNRYLLPVAAHRYSDLVFCDNDTSHRIYTNVSRHPANYRVINNSVSGGVKLLINRAAVCTTSSRIDAMGFFGSCSSTRRENEEYYSMNVNIKSSDERSYYSAITKVTTEQRKSKATVTNMFNVGNLVMNSLNEKIDLQTNPTILSANNVFKRSINEIMRIWKSEPAMLPAVLWAALETNKNFTSMMNELSQKGIGDIHQEFGGVVAEAGYINPPQSIVNILNHKISLFLAGDRPSAVRAMLFPMYSLLPEQLLKRGQVIVGYGNDTNSFLVRHRLIQADVVRGGSRSRIKTIKNKIRRKHISYKHQHNNTKKRS
jgi:hypothetical protein